jgi:hypothetical protein
MNCIPLKELEQMSNENLNAYERFKLIQNILLQGAIHKCDRTYEWMQFYSNQVDIYCEMTDMTKKEYNNFTDNDLSYLVNYIEIYKNRICENYESNIKLVDNLRDLNKKIKKITEYDNDEVINLINLIKKKIVCNVTDKLLSLSIGKLGEDNKNIHDHVDALMFMTTFEPDCEICKLYTICASYGNHRYECLDAMKRKLNVK